MVGVECHKLTKSYGRQVALDQLDWAVEAGQSWGLVGPSGAGKTTLLRMLAGLDRASSGEVLFRDPGQTRLPKPRVGMVFQHLGLWPHLTAAQHIACVVSGASYQERGRIVGERLAEVHLPAECHDKRPAQLSGGELQRLAIARALAIRPQVLLLDEPLAQVDAPLRAELIALLRELIARHQMTSIYVTHSWSEASQVAQQMAVLVDGKMAQTGSVYSVYQNPVSAQVARLTGTVVEIPRGAIRQSRIALTESAAAINMQDDPCAIRPQQLELIASDGENRWEVIECHLFGIAWQAIFRSGPDRIQTPVQRRLSPGDIMGLRIKDLSG